jgi:hypothetical protein
VLQVVLVGGGDGGNSISFTGYYLEQQILVVVEVVEEMECHTKWCYMVVQE